MAPSTGCTLYFIDANGRIGSVLSECVGATHADTETRNGHYFHRWMHQLGICALSTFRCKGPGATWRSTQNTLRRIDFVCAPCWLMGFPFDTWVASNLDVATKKDDHFPTVAELLWQPLPPCCPVSWNTPLMSRASLKDEASSAHFRHWLSLVPVPPVCTPVEAHHAYVVSVLQEVGALFFPVQRKDEKKKAGFRKAPGK